jgi:hypothetical protein
MLIFRTLLANYPSSDPCDAKNEKGGLLFENQCAIRLSHAMKKSGVSFASFPASRKCWVHRNEDHILAAAELGNWLDRGGVAGVAKSKDVTGSEWRKQVVDKTGIICFKDCYAGSGGSGGDHIDLWDKSSLTGTGSWVRTRFSVVIPGYWSDFRKSKKIRFFELK